MGYRIVTSLATSIYPCKRLAQKSDTKGYDTGRSTERLVSQASKQSTNLLSVSEPKN